MTKEIKDIGKYHQNKIRKHANKYPLMAYFLGGFDLVDDDKKLVAENHKLREFKNKFRSLVDLSFEEDLSIS